MDSEKGNTINTLPRGARNDASSFSSSEKVDKVGVETAHALAHIDTAAENRLIRHQDLRILPVIAITYLLVRSFAAPRELCLILARRPLSTEVRCSSSLDSSCSLSSQPTWAMLASVRGCLTLSQA